MVLHTEFSLTEKIHRINLFFVSAILLLGLIGILLLYSAAGGAWTPWALNHGIKLFFGFILMLIVALTPLQFFYRWAYRFYWLMLALLFFVELKGHIGMGAQRWIHLGFMTLQPSELMKIALILALAKYYHSIGIHQAQRKTTLIIPLFLIAMPVLLVLIQPNLGTALLLTAAGLTILFGAGIQLYYFAISFFAALISMPLLWKFVLKNYQKKRILTFLNPENDPLGAGYNIIQSKIALGSGGIWGKGFIQGTQNQLMFLPEKHTDFIFVLLAEEFGFLGCLITLALIAIISYYGMLQATLCRNQFGRLIALGIGMSFFLYAFVNIGMVSGVLPVVGIPIPMLSFGGTAMMTYMIGCGLLINISLNRSVELHKEL